VFSSGNGIIGIFIPVVLSIVLVISEGGFADYGTGAFYAFVRSLTFNVYFWSVVLIAVVSIFYISAMYLVQFAWKMGNEPLTEHFRNYALFLSMPTVLASGVVFLGLESQNPEHFSAALDGLWPFVLSLICLLAAVTLVFLRKYPWTFLFVMLQYFFALYGYTVSHFPYLVYPDIVLNSGLSNWAKSAWFFVFSLVISIGTLVCYLRIRCWNVADQKHHE
jgi:cytochrome d ubiquinol oxidase subunit II